MKRLSYQKVRAILQWNGLDIGHWEHNQFAGGFVEVKRMFSDPHKAQFVRVVMHVKAKSTHAKFQRREKLAERIKKAMEAEDLIARRLDYDTFLVAPSK